MTKYQHVTDPTMVIADQEFHERLVLEGSQIYGRILFRAHCIEIHRNVFRGGLLLTNIVNAVVADNLFTSDAYFDFHENEVSA